MTKKLEKAIEQVLNRREIEDAYQFIDEIKKIYKAKKGDEYLLDMLDAYIVENGITDITIDYENYRLIYREKLFVNTTFKIQMTEEEVREKMMIVGHRFVPYIHPGIHPRELMLIDTDDVEITLKEQQRTFIDSLIWFSLLPPYGLQHYDLDEEGNINVSYYDLSDWMQKNDFDIKDNILISPIDYQKNIFRIDKISRRKLAEQKIITNNKDQQLSEELLTLLYLEDLMLPVDMQLFQAFALLPEKLINNPGSSIGPFLSNHEELGIFNNGIYAYVNAKDHQTDMFNMALDEAMFPDLDMMGEATDLDGIFRELGNSFGESFVEAKFIEQMHERDAIDTDEVYDIIFRKNEAIFYNDKQEDNFNKAFKQLANKVEKKRKGKKLSLPLKNLLSKTISFKVQIINLLRKIDDRLENPDNFDFSILMPIQPFEILTDQLLENILHDDDTVSPRILADISKQVNQMQEEFQLASNHILDNL